MIRMADGDIQYTICYYSCQWKINVFWYNFETLWFDRCYFPYPMDLVFHSISE